MKVTRKISRRKFLALTATAAVGGLGYTRFLEPRWLAIRRHDVRVTTGKHRSPLTVLHLSDFHASAVVSMAFIEKAVRIGLEQNPDLICLTGDFITCGYADPDDYAKVLSLLTKAAPTFGCLGNHDGGTWASRRGGHGDTKFVRGVLERAGVSLLHNAAEEFSLGDWHLAVVGLGDSWAGEMRPDIPFAQLSAEPADAILTLAHNPDVKENLLPHSWNLLLCGHTHGGQLRVPLVGAPFAPVRDKAFIEGLHRWNERWIHITRGIGNLHGLRFNCRPEISVLTLT